MASPGNGGPDNAKGTGNMGQTGHMATPATDKEARVPERQNTAAASWCLTVALLRHLVDDGMVAHEDAVGVIGEALKTMREILPEYRTGASLLEHERANWEQEDAAEH